MPTLNIITNVPGNSVDSSDAIKALSQAVASSVGKPETYVLITLITDKPCCFGGSEEPCAYGELLSIGSIGGEKNKSISKVISEVVQAKLRVAPGRFYLKFTDAQRTDFGWNGSTF